MNTQLSVTAWAGNVLARFQQWEVVAEPDRDEPEWWAGAPSVVRDRQGVFWMALRMRTAEGELGKRGYEIRLLRSDDGVHFVKVHSIKREQIPTTGFERPALLIDPHSGRFKLYTCGPLTGDWCIFKFADVDDPRAFDPATAKPVIEAMPSHPQRVPYPSAYKDPFILYAEGAYHCYAIGVLRAERIFHFTSEDGETWYPVGHPSESLLPLAGWHSFYVRPACLLPVGVGYLFIYEGSSTQWDDPVYNIATGVGFTFDLHHVVDLTPDAPLLTSPTPGRLNVWRYSHWMWVDNELWVYAEVEKPNSAHETRLFRLPLQPL